MSHPVNTPWTGAIVFCANPHNGHVLFVERRNSSTAYGGLVGGKVEAGESYREAALREFTEETGLTLAYLSDEALFHGYPVAASGASCSIFLGTLGPKDWEAVMNGYVGPEGLKVQEAPWNSVVREECCEFAEFNLRFLKQVQSEELLQRHFAEASLNTLYKEIIEASDL